MSTNYNIIVPRLTSVRYRRTAPITSVWVAAFFFRFGASNETGEQQKTGAAMKQFFSWRQAVLNSKLQSTTRHILLTLSCHMNDAGESCYPSIMLLTKETGLSKTTVMAHLRIAANDGWITVDKHGLAGQRWARNEYRISWPKAVKEVDHDTEKAVNLTIQGGQPNARKAVKQVDPSTSVSTSLNSTIEAEQEKINITGPPLLTIPLIKRDGEFDIDQNYIDELTADFPAVDIIQQLKQMRRWCIDNPERRKTRGGLPRFIARWLGKEQDRAGDRNFRTAVGKMGRVAAGIQALQDEKT